MHGARGIFVAFTADYDTKASSDNVHLKFLILCHPFSQRRDSLCM